MAAGRKRITILDITQIIDRTIPLKPQKKALVTFRVNDEPAKVLTFDADVAADEKRLIVAIQQALAAMPKPSPFIGKTYEVE